MTTLCGVIIMPFVLPREPVHGNSLPGTFVWLDSRSSMSAKPLCACRWRRKSFKLPRCRAQSDSQILSLKAGHPTSQDVMRQAFLRDQTKFLIRFREVSFQYHFESRVFRSGSRIPHHVITIDQETGW